MVFEFLAKIVHELEVHSKIQQLKVCHGNFVPVKILVQDHFFRKNSSVSEQFFRKNWTGLENFVPLNVCNFSCHRTSSMIEANYV